MIIEIKDNQNNVIATVEAPDNTPYWRIQQIIDSYKVKNKSIQEIISEKMNEVLIFGNLIKKQFIDENVMLGITQLGLTNHVRKTMREVNDAIGTGSLKDAIEEIALINPAHLDDVILSQSRLLAFRNKIENFLNVPLAKVWNEEKTW